MPACRICGMEQAMILNSAARRDVVERVDRFLNGLEGAKRQPNRRELFWLRIALANLQEDQRLAGEDAMDKAERAMPIPEHAAGDLATNAVMTVAQLRGLLEGIV